MKKTIATITLAAVMTFGATFANANSNTGIIVAGLNSGDCTTTSDAGNTGIIVAGLTGIIVAGLTGIIVAGAVDTPCTTTSDFGNTGIIVAG